MDDDKTAAKPSDADLALGQELEDAEAAKPSSTGEPQAPEEPGKKPEGKPEKEKTPAEPEEPETPPEGDEGEEPGEPDQKPVSRRESKRIKQLLEKLAAKDQPSVGSQPNAQPARPGQPGGRKQIIEEGDYTLEQINGMADEYAQKRYEEGLAQAQAQTIAQTNLLSFYTDLKIDTPQVASKYDFMNEESPDFDPARTELLNEAYLSFVGYQPGDAQRGIQASVQRPNIGYAEFIDSIMDVVEVQAAAQVVDSQKSLSKQAAQTGIRPGGAARQQYTGDDPSQMTDEQLDAAINQGLSMLPGTRRRR